MRPATSREATTTMPHTISNHRARGADFDSDQADANHDYRPDALSSGYLPDQLWARCLAQGWQEGRLVEPVPVPELPEAQHALRIGRLLVWAEIGGDRPPPRFGLHNHCDPRRRCVNCHIACQSETALQKLHELTGLMPLVLTLGGSLEAPTWARAALWLPWSPYLSGIWIPMMSAVDGAVALCAPDRREIIWPTSDGVEVRTVYDGALAQGRGQRLFLRSLSRTWRTLQHDRAKAPANVPTLQGMA